MAYLLDTNHCIYLMNGWNNPKDKLSHQERNTVAAFSKIGNDVIYMCEASIGELVYGVERSKRKEYNLRKLKSLLLAVPPIPVTRSVWDIYGQTKAQLVKVGKIMPDIDLLISSAVKYNDLVLVGNDKHMNNLPESFIRENWAGV